MTGKSFLQVVRVFFPFSLFPLPSSTFCFILYDFRSHSLHFSRFLILSLLNVYCCSVWIDKKYMCIYIKGTILVESFKIILVPLISTLHFFRDRETETERGTWLLVFLILLFAFCSNCHLFVCRLCAVCVSNVFMCMCAYSHLVIWNLLGSNRAHSTDTSSHHYVYLSFSVSLFSPHSLSRRSTQFTEWVWAPILWGVFVSWLFIFETGELSQNNILSAACVCKCRIRALLVIERKLFDHTQTYTDFNRCHILENYQQEEEE